MAAKSLHAEPNLEGDNWHEAYNSICDYYRRALLNALYCGNRLGRARRTNLGLELAIAIGASVSAGLTASKTSLVPPEAVSAFAIAVGALAVTKPVLKLGATVERYASQYGSYRGIYFSYRDLIDTIRIERRVTTRAWGEHAALRARFQDLEKAGDQNPSVGLRAALRTEVEKQVPIDSLRIF